MIKTWTEVAARVHLDMLTSDLTSLVPPQFSYWLQVRKVGSAYLSFCCKTYFVKESTTFSSYAKVQPPTTSPISSSSQVSRKVQLINISMPMAIMIQ